MEPKWQRIRFMPATPLGADGARVTGCEAHIALSRRAATEGMVLLKNENETLPLKHGTRVAVFGKAQADYVKGGGGSGDTTVAYVRSLAQGLRIKQGEGKIEVFEPLERFYAENVSAQFAAGATPGKTREPILSDELVKQARAFTDTAILTICRFSGEDYDRTGQPHDGDYFLSFEEEHMVKKVLAAFPRVAVVLNTGGMMDTLWFRDNPAVGAALLAWQGGMEGGLAAADILVGDICPSGHLTDTFASSFAAYPSSANFAESRLYVEYQEDVFVGYPRRGGLRLLSVRLRPELHDVCAERCARRHERSGRNRAERDGHEHGLVRGQIRFAGVCQPAEGTNRQACGGVGRLCQNAAARTE